MRKLILTITVLIGLSVALPANAQVGSVRLKVTKNSRKDRKTTQQDRYGQYRTQDINETVTYTIEVINMSSTPIEGMRIQWAVLVNPYGRSGGLSSAKLYAGEKTTDLKNGQKFNFDTDKIELASTQRDSSYYGSTRTKTGAEIEGYVIEVYVKGAVVASEVLPIDAKKKIDQFKARNASR